MGSQVSQNTSKSKTLPATGATSSQRGHSAPAQANSAAIVRAPGLAGIEVWTSNNVGFDFDMITDCYQFGLPHEDYRSRMQGTATYDRETIRISGMHMMLMRPGEVVRARSNTGGFGAYLVRIEPSRIASVLDEDRINLNLRHWAIANPQLSLALTRVCQSLGLPDHEPLQQHHYLQQFLTLASTLSDGPSRTPPASGCGRSVKMVRHLLEDRYHEPLTLQMLATEVGLSCYHLARSFSSQLKVPIHRYLQLVRVRRAIELMRHGHQPSEVWPRCGFSDQAHMTRIFRQRIGFTPGQFCELRSR